MTFLLHLNYSASDLFLSSTALCSILLVPIYKKSTVISIQATRAQMGGTGGVPSVNNLGDTWGCVVDATLPPEKIGTHYSGEWVNLGAEIVWSRKCHPQGGSNPRPSSRSELLYRLRYLGRQWKCRTCEK